MTLEQIIKELSMWLKEYPKAKITFNLEVGSGKSVLIWSVYPETYEDNGETYIVISNKHTVLDKFREELSVLQDRSIILEGTISRLEHSLRWEGLELQEKWND